jgi:hypothetical protein
MTASALRLAFLLAIAGAVAFHLGRQRFGGHESTCALGGHVPWQPGLLRPRVHDVAEGSDCVPD